MYRLLDADKDAYITDRIIDNSFRAKDGNTGLAGTLDLFKLHDESSISGVDEPQELSRLFVHFDLNPLRALTASLLDLDSSTFKCTLRLSDVIGGQPVPSNFTVAVYPLSKSFDEGVGRDVGRYADLDAVNFVTASTVDGVVSAWNAEGANAEGLLGSSDIDIITSGNLLDGEGVVQLYKTQAFASGEEDLEVDVTNIVSATLVGTIPDFGYRISLSGTFETNSSSYFVKRFASRHSSNPRKRPKLVVQYDDSLIDNHENFVFDTTGSLFLFNTVRGQPKNIVSGAAATELTGTGTLTLKLISGAVAPSASSSYTKSISADQFSYGNNFVTGTYVATFALSSFDDTGLRGEVERAGSASFTTIWGSNDGNVAFETGSIVITRPKASSYIQGDRAYTVNIENHRQTYLTTEVPRIRVNVFDLSIDDTVFFTKRPVQDPGVIVEKMYWRLVDVYSGEVVIPFDTTLDATRLSADSRGLFFDFYPADLTVGRVLGFQFLIRDDGDDIVIDENLPTFRIE